VGKRAKEIVLGALLAVLAAVAYWTLMSTSSTPALPSNQGRPPSAAAHGKQTQANGAPAVNLGALEGERPAPADAERNLFRFKPKAPPPEPPRPAAPSMTTPVAPVAPTGPPPPPPITLKFIGLMEQPGTKVKIAVLTDGQGPPMFGEEGKTVGGRYRVLRIGVESVELSYLDGRGRQTIRLTGG